MPIEIRELNIKVNISEGGSASAAPSAAPEGGNAGTGANDQQDALIAMVIEKVLEILKRQNER